MSKPNEGYVHVHTGKKKTQDFSECKEFGNSNSKTPLSLTILTRDKLLRQDGEGAYYFLKSMKRTPKKQQSEMIS